VYWTRLRLNLNHSKMSLKISKKFEPLFRLFDENYYPDVDTIIITGGRYSLKSYTVSILALIALVNYGWNTLYTRFTNMSIVDSVKPEVSDKIELLGLTGKVNDTQGSIDYKGNRISFKGINTGSKGQTANLKSLSGFNLFVNDEAEELPDYKTFKKIFYSIRSTTKRNLTILILNPTSRDHWIFTEFFEKKGLEGGDNCIKDNVMYIHSSYLDCDFKQMPKNILADYERMKIEDPEGYDNIVLGGWISQLEGAVLPKGSMKTYSEFPFEYIDHEGKLMSEPYFNFAFADTADEGKDNFSMPIFRVYQRLNRIYLYDAIFDTANLTIQEGQVIGKCKEHNIRKMVVETNSAGAYFKRRLEELMAGVEVYGQWSSVNKMRRITSYAGLAKTYVLIPENPNETVQKFLKQVYKLLNTSKDEDDAPDSLCGAVAHLEMRYGMFKIGEENTQ